MGKLVPYLPVSPAPMRVGKEGKIGESGRTPIVPLHYLLAIPPLPLTIIKLTDVFRTRLQRLPPSHLIRTITTYNPAADWHLSLQPPTCLTRLLPDSFPPFVYPSPTYESTWSHPLVQDNTVFKISPATKEATKSLINQPPYDIYHLFVRVLTIPSPPFAASFLLFKGQTLVHSGATRHASKLRALFMALCNGLTYNSLSNHIRIFLPDLSLQPYLFRSHKHPLLDLSHTFLSLLSSFLLGDPVHHVDLFRYSIKWSGLPGMATVDTLSEEQQRIVFPDPPPSLLLPKARLLRLFQEQYDLLRRDSRIWQSIIRPDGRPPPFIEGALSCKDRRTFSSAVQLAFDHAFTITYSDIFRRHANDNPFCPEHSTPTPSTLLSPLSEQARFDLLMAEQHRNPRPSQSPDPSRASLPRPQRLSPRGRFQRPSPRNHFRNTTDHVLFHCSPLSSPRRRFFGSRPFDPYVFGTFHGAVSLGDFQRATNRLLRPLPPRPDPP